VTPQRRDDWNDAAGICEAAQRPTMRFVATKSLEQQDLLAIRKRAPMAALTSAHGLVKWLTALFTPSLLPLPCIESTE
jgi:transposase